MKATQAKRKLYMCRCGSHLCPMEPAVPEVSVEKFMMGHVVRIHGHWIAKYPEPVAQSVAQNIRRALSEWLEETRGCSSHDQETTQT